MIESVIKPIRIEDYSVSFNDWLSDTVDNFVEVDYLVTDPSLDTRTMENSILFLKTWMMLSHYL